MPRLRALLCLALLRRVRFRLRGLFRNPGFSCAILLDWTFPICLASALLLFRWIRYALSFRWTRAVFVLRLRWWNWAPLGAIWRNLSLPLRFCFIFWGPVGFWAHNMGVVYIHDGKCKHRTQIRKEYCGLRWCKIHNLLTIAFWELDGPVRNLLRLSLAH